MSPTPQTLTLAGEDYVVIRREEYEQLRAAADEDAADLAVIRRVLDDPDQIWAPADLVRRIAEGEHPVRAWRTHRSMTARALAAKAGIPSSYLSAIERGAKPGSVKALKSLATALGVSLDDLV
ncbi:MAG: helix-turn-helix transcriptional regulator [Acidobacteria bacterium]|nr:helix-turn-helix transcriptional regulator [Acidobacteriota bacterium]MYJ03442.1 helix-turn-helix transcriptional regulator [Acidobacteriota bacterium]